MSIEQEQGYRESLAEGREAIALLAVAKLSKDKERLSLALAELIGAAEHCGDGDAPIVVKARAALKD
jgi:hypothetical protein